MDQENQQSISYKRLVNREAYYKNKSLKLEKDYIFAKEKIAWLENRLDKVKEELSEREQNLESVQAKWEQLNESYQEIQFEFNEAKELNQQNEQKLLEINNKPKFEMNDKVAQYEALLSEVQEEMNVKEKQIFIFKQRIERLEKQLRSNQPLQIIQKPNIDQVKKNNQQKYKAMAYMDYACIFDQKKCIIRGDYIIENIGQDELTNPLICCRFYPEDMANIKGKTIASSNNEAIENDSGYWEIIEEPDWVKDAKERGELWLRPKNPITLSSGKNIVVNDLQIVINTQLVDHITVETFVYFTKEDYRIKGVNQIAINF